MSKVTEEQYKEAVHLLKNYDIKVWIRRNLRGGRYYEISRKRHRQRNYRDARFIGTHIAHKLSFIQYTLLKDKRE